MFTGLVQRIGQVVRATPRDGGLSLSIGVEEPWEDPLVPGESVAVDGACLTVTTVESAGFRVDLSHASIGATTLGSSQAGRRVHLERALRLADRLGGHLVSGHVDGVAVLRDIRVRGDFLDLVVVPPRDQLPLLAPKGSVALDGVSLTINTVAGDSFHVAVIPHTQGLTTLGDWRPGRKINLESDLVAKYLHRLTEHREAPGKLADWLAGHDRGREER